MKMKRKGYDANCSSANKVKNILTHQTTDGKTFDDRFDAVRYQFHLDSMENKKNKGES